MSSSEVFASLEARFVRWATAEPGVRAVIAVGSRARAHPPADDWSDLDLVVYARDPGVFLKDTGWLDDVAPVCVAIPGRTAGGEPEVLAMFDGGFDVDVVVARVEDLQAMAQTGAVPAGHLRGARVLVDKDGWAAGTIPGDFGPPRPADVHEVDFAGLVAAFWYGAHYVAKQIRRGDLWVVKVRDMELKALLLGMLEWHARTKGPDIDTWHLGRYYWQWADPRAVTALDEVFGRFDRGDSWRALLATMDLFSWLGIEVASSLEVQYPMQTELAVRDLIDHMCEGRDT